MRIGIGVLAGITGGPARYGRELAGALAREGIHEYVVFTDRPEDFASVDVETVEVPFDRIHHQVTWDHLRLPGLLARHAVSLYHGTKNVLPWRLSVPGVVTVHDLAVYAYPATFAWPQRAHFRLTVPFSISRAACVIADSEHARRDLLQRFQLAPERIRTVPLGVTAACGDPSTPAAIEQLRVAHGLGPKLVACTGTIQPRKRVDRVLEAFVSADGPGRGWELAIAGRCRPGHSPSWLSNPPTGVRWLGLLSDEELGTLYAASQIFVSASEYEGFGLTICEAMASGCAVVAVANSAIPELVGEAGLLVPRSEVQLLAEALTRLFRDPEERSILGQEARARATRFTWEETARRTRGIYEEVADRHLR